METHQIEGNRVGYGAIEQKRRGVLEFRGRFCVEVLRGRDMLCVLRLRISGVSELWSNVDWVA